MKTYVPAFALALGACSRPSGAPPPAGLYEVLRTWTGDELDHLGIGISALGDVNGDGEPDFILGKMTGAYTFYFGPGAARVISGKDGSLLYEVRGTDKEGRHGGDAYGDSIASIGDIDRDGVPDFAVGAWRYDGHLGLAVVYSGRDGKPLATIYGDGRITRGEGPESPKDCDQWKCEGFGKTILGLGDMNGDGVPDFAVGGDYPGGGSLIVSGAELTLQGNFPGIVLGMTGDLDKDGRPDVACLTGLGAEDYLQIQSTADRHTILAFPLRGQFSIECQVGYRFAPAGDVDGDGFLDLFTVETDVGDRPTDPAPDIPIVARWISGRTGDELFRLSLDPGEYTQRASASAIGDVDGDGRIDFFVQAQLRSAGAKQWILSGGKAKVLAEAKTANATEGRTVARLGNAAGDPSCRLLVSDYESQSGAKCGGAVYLARLRLPTK